MLRLPPIALVVLCLVLGSPAADPPLGPSASAVVFGGPDTTVNGTHVVDNLPAFPGQVVETHSSRTATMVINGASLRVLGQSRILFRGASADLLSGSISVSTTVQFPVQADCFLARPADNVSSRYSILARDGNLYFAAERGELLVKAHEELRVPSGKGMVITGCGKPGEVMQVVELHDLRYKVIFGAALAAGALSPLLAPRHFVSEEAPVPKP